MRVLFLLVTACCLLLFGCSKTTLNHANMNKEFLDHQSSSQKLVEPQNNSVNIEQNIEQNLSEPQMISVNTEPISMEQQHEQPKENNVNNEQLLLQNTTDNQTTPLTIEQYIQYDFKEPEIIENVGTTIYYLALGDSLTRGIGDEEKKNGYTKRLADKIEQWTPASHVYLDNRGKRGRRSDQLLALIKKGHYDNELKSSNLITITIGGNDIMKVVKKDLFDLKKSSFDQELVEFTTRYDQIIQEIRLRNVEVPIIIIGLYNPFSLISEEVSEFDMIMEEWNNSMKELSDKHVNACFVEVEELFENNNTLVYHSDFFHPNGYGYTMMTERIVSIMETCDIEEKTNGLILFNRENALSE